MLEFSGQHVPNITHRVRVSKGEAQNAICLILVPDEGHDQVVWKTPSRLIRLASSGYRWFQGKDSQVAKSLGLSKGSEVGVG